jgi:hypothetical protein
MIAAGFSVPIDSPWKLVAMLAVIALMAWVAFNLPKSTR